MASLCQEALYRVDIQLTASTAFRLHVHREACTQPITQAVTSAQSSLHAHHDGVFKYQHKASVQPGDGAKRRTKQRKPFKVENHLTHD